MKLLLRNASILLFRFAKTHKHGAWEKLIRRLCRRQHKTKTNKNGFRGGIVLRAMDRWLCDIPLKHIPIALLSTHSSEWTLLSRRVIWVLISTEILVWMLINCANRKKPNKKIIIGVLGLDSVWTWTLGPRSTYFHIPPLIALNLINTKI